MFSASPVPAFLNNPVQAAAYASGPVHRCIPLDKTESMIVGAGL